MGPKDLDAVPRHQSLQARHSQRAGVQLRLRVLLFPHGLHLHTSRTSSLPSSKLMLSLVVAPIVACSGGDGGGAATGVSSSSSLEELRSMANDSFAESARYSVTFTLLQARGCDSVRGAAAHAAKIFGSDSYNLRLWCRNAAKRPLTGRLRLVAHFVHTYPTHIESTNVY